jgi:hypothetical protein
MVLVLMKPYWFWWISGIISFCSLLANNFVIIFSDILTKDIGLKSEGVSGELIFGMRVMNAVFRL